MPKSRRRSVKKIEIICAQCNLSIQESDESIECDKCKKAFHVVCTSLDKRKFEYLLKHETEEFVCHICEPNNNNNNFSLHTELNAIKTELKKLDQLSVLNESMNFMSNKFDELIKGVAENRKKVENLQKENKELREEINMLKYSVKYLNDQRVKNDCLLSGIEVNNNVSAVDAVLKFTEETGAEISEDNINDAYFLKTKNTTSNKKSVVIKFNSKKSKDKLMAVKPKLKEKEETKKIYINDYLSRETINLFNYTKSLKKIGYRFVYVYDGKVFAKMGELSRPKLIRCAEEVDKLLLEATTYRAKKQSVQQNVNYHDDNDNSLDSE